MLALVLALSATACGSSAKHAGFSARVDNKWFPLLPGTRLVYRGVKDGRRARDVVKVSHETKTIDGAPCAIVRDRLYLNGRLEERTTDWYTQDGRGNVWYYGEATAELDPSGKVKSTEGSWQAGRNGAKPGVYMPAQPKVGQSGRQEYYKGQAEDHFKVLNVTRHQVITKEWTPLEPGVIDHKLYRRGTGTVLEQTVRGGDERLRLVSKS